MTLALVLVFFVLVVTYCVYMFVYVMFTIGTCSAVPPTMATSNDE